MAYFSSIALKATQGEAPYKYLSVITNDKETQGYLEYSADEVDNPNAKFAVEHAHNGLVHIRSCRTNKYWVRSSNEGYWIVAKASQPLDDKTAWNSTLFRMDLISDDNKATFVHVQSGTVLRIPNDNSNRKMFLCINPSTTTEAISTVVDFESFQLLPKYIALKAANGKFFDYDTKAFTSDDYGKASVVNEITTNVDGYITIRKKGPPQTYVWYCEMDYIWINSHTTILPGTLFEVVKVKDNVIALRSLENGKFCRCGYWNNDKAPAHLTVTATTIVKEAQFQVVETVLSRRIKVLDFDLDNSRIYNITPISSETHTFDNPTDKEQEGSLNLSISYTKTTTWNNTFSITGGVEFSITTGIPRIAEGKITVSAEISYSHEFGGSTQDTRQIGDTYTVKVPPFTRAVGRGMATKGTCDVPFSYTQVDNLTDGSTIRKTLFNGLFTGVDAYNFYHDVKYESLPH